MLPRLFVYQNIRTQQIEKIPKKHTQIQQFRIFNKNIAVQKKLNKSQKRQLQLQQVQSIQQLKGISLSVNQDQMKESNNQKERFIIKKPNKNILLNKKNSKFKSKLEKNKFKPSLFQTINSQKYQNLNQQIKIKQLSTNIPAKIDKQHVKTWKENIVKSNELIKFKQNKKILRYIQQNNQQQKDRDQLIAQSFSFDRSYEHFKKYEDGIPDNSLSYNRRIHLKNIKDFLCQQQSQQSNCLKQKRQQLIQLIQKNKLQTGQNGVQLQKQQFKSRISNLKQKIHLLSSSHKAILTNKNIFLFKSISNQSKDSNQNFSQILTKQIQTPDQLDSLIPQQATIKHQINAKDSELIPRQYNIFKQINPKKKSLKKDKLRLQDIINLNLKQNHENIKIDNKINLKTIKCSVSFLNKKQFD